MAMEQLHNNLQAISQYYRERIGHASDVQEMVDLFEKYNEEVTSLGKNYAGDIIKKCFQAFERELTDPDKKLEWYRKDYREEMRHYYENHPLPLTLPDMEDVNNLSFSSINRTSMTILGCGTVLSLTLLVAGLKWYALAAGCITLTGSVITYQPVKPKIRETFSLIFDRYTTPMAEHMQIWLEEIRKECQNKIEQFELSYE